MDKLQQIATTAAAVAVIIGAAYAIGRLLRSLIELGRKLGRLADDLLGEPAHAGRPAVAGLLERVGAIEDHVAPLPLRLDALDQAAADIRGEVGDLRRRIGAIEAELKPNGGSTVRDAVDRIEERLATE